MDSEFTTFQQANGCQLISNYCHLQLLAWRGAARITDYEELSFVTTQMDSKSKFTDVIRTGHKPTQSKINKYTLHYNTVILFVKTLKVKT